ncbi:hypothetical protein AVEN_94727-1 [Araneus ventricosus]|uniref:Uncharacterized protein n=1 Tax=Araneus ventricosus TaxID=182803 RepID=A0A4Y2CQ31_ARAVE|nr:hypothetical protein AVEN_94727-1 [Araneus ventricosus]
MKVLAVIPVLLGQFDESTGPFYGGKQGISGSNCITVQQTVVPLSSARNRTPKAGIAQNNRNPTSLLSLPQISLSLACGGRSTPEFTGTLGSTPSSNAPIGLKRDVAKLCAITAKFSYLEPRSTTFILTL